MRINQQHLTCIFHSQAQTSLVRSPIKIRPLELAVEWDLPESSIYEAIAKLKELRLIEIEQAEIVIRWCDPPEGDSFKIPALLATPKNNGFNDPSVSNQSLSHSQQATDFWESRNDSGKSETILESQNDFWDLRNDSGKSEIKDTEALQENSSDCAYTIQTFKTPHTFLNSTGTEKISEEEKEETDQRISLESVGQIIQSKVQLLMQPTDLTKDQSSAPPPDPVEKISASLDPHPTARMEQQFQRGGQLPPWRTGSSPNDLNPEFVEWIRQWLCTIPPERDRSRGDAIAYIRKQEHTGDNAVLEARAQEWLVTAQKARDNQKQQQMMIHRVVLSEKPLLPDDQEETRANLRRINELIQQNRRQRSTQPLEPSMASPSDSSLTEAQIDCDQRDCVDLLSRISIQRRRLGWDIDQIRQWFIRTFGQTSDRLDDEQLLDAVISLEGLALT
ncbi:MAG: hypothetical protein HC940_00825 [Acaryochloris sp. SU_5_25]|nr:hypothetical protein [Acaryochloris sp. SU_5_25]